MPPFAPFKPAAPYLMDAGKELAWSGYFLSALTTELNLDGGALSESGAQIRNAGDCLARAGELMQFKVEVELVAEKIREAVTCMETAVVKLELAEKEAKMDNNPVLARNIGAFVCDFVCVRVRFFIDLIP